MKLFNVTLTLLSCLAFSSDVPLINSPVSISIKSDCKTEPCKLTLCFSNLRDKSLKIGSAFLDENQMIVSGMLFYPLEDYIKAGSDIYSPKLKIERESMKDFFKENYLKNFEGMTEISFNSREQKCFSLNIEKAYTLEKGRYYIGHYFLQDAYVLDSKEIGFFLDSSNIIVIQKN